MAKSKPGANAATASEELMSSEACATATTQTLPEAIRIHPKMIASSTQYGIVINVPKYG